MTAARTARRKAIRLGRRSSVGDNSVRPIASLPWLTTTAGQRLDALSARPAVLQRPAARRCHPTCSPSAPSQRRLLRPNPHRACCNRRCPLSAISCLGASRTPAVGARGWRRHAGVRETCTMHVDGDVMQASEKPAQYLHNNLHNARGWRRHAGVRETCTIKRDFVPWRFSDACRRRTWMATSCRRPRNLHNRETCTIEKPAQSRNLHNSGPHAHGSVRTRRNGK